MGSRVGKQIIMEVVEQNVQEVLESTEGESLDFPWGFGSSTEDSTLDLNWKGHSPL